MTKKGRKFYEPNDKHRKTVISYTKAGISQVDICKIIEIDLKTLRKYYRTELDTEAIKANAMVGSTLFDLATSGTCPAATFFWGKTKMGLRETDRPIDNAQPIKIEIIGGPIRKSQLVKDEPDQKTGTE